MSSQGAGYDLSVSQFSPDGKIYQVEYAMKAIENGGSTVAVKCKDCVVFGVEKLIKSKLYQEKTDSRIFTVDTHIGAAIAGMLPDARKIISVAQDEASNYRKQYGAPIPLKHLSDRVSMYIHAHTLYSSVRPFGMSVAFSSYEDGKPLLYVIDPSGVHHGSTGAAMGKGKQEAKTKIEQIITNREMTGRELIKEVAKLVYEVHDDIKDKTFELELSWVGKDTNGLHKVIKDTLFEEAEQFAKVAKAEADSDADD